jgi:hypothetical protein
MSFFAKLETTTDRFLDFVFRAKNEEPVLEHKYDILKTKIASLDVRLDEQTKSIREGLEKLAATRVEFSNILNDVGDREAKFLAEMKEAYTYFSPKTLSEQLNTSLITAVGGVVQNLEEHLHQTLDKYSEINSGVATMHSHFRDFDHHLQKQATDELKSREFIMSILSRVTQAQDTFAQQFNTPKVQANLEKSIREAGDKVTSEYVRALGEMLPHLQSLSTHIADFNKKAYAEVKQRDTTQLIKGISQNTGELFLRIFRGILSIFSKK